MTAYLVSKTTKEHFLARNFCAADANDEDLILVKGDADGWIKWHGEKCPLPHDQLCEVKLGYAKEILQEGAMPASRWHWARGSLSRAADIFAYRPILDDKPQAPEWDGEGLPPVGTVCEICTEDGWLECKIVFNNNDYAIGHILPAQASLLKCDWSRGGFRPIRTDREKWIEAAHDAGGYTDNNIVRKVASQIYDALKSGELPNPTRQTGGDA